MDTKKGRIPTGLETKNSIAVQNVTAIHRTTENNGESVPAERRKGDLRDSKKQIQKINFFANIANE